MLNWLTNTTKYLNKFLEVGILLLAVSVVAELVFGPNVAFFGTQVTKNFDPEILTVIHHYPASQAALARISPNDDQVSDRFEVFYGNIELANGYVELTDIHQTRQRFQNDQQLRQKQGKVTRPLDEYFIAAIASGLPDCAGVALGFDRLFMISEGKSDIQSVQPFTIK